MSRHLESQGMWSSSPHPVSGLGQTPLSRGNPQQHQKTPPSLAVPWKSKVTPCVFFQHMTFSRSTLTSFQFLGSFHFYLHLLFPPTHKGFHLGGSFHF